MIKYLLVGLLLANSGWAAPLDRIVAVVNNEVVLDSELVEMEQTVRQQLRQRNATIPSSEILRRQVLERIIMQRLQIQRAEMSGIRVTDDALNAAIRQIAESNNLTLRQFRDALESDGYDFAEFRETIREEMVINRLRKAEVEDSIVVSEREVDNFLATQNLQGDSEQAFRLLHILVALPDAPAPEQVQAAEEKLAEIQGLLDQGGDFSEVAAGYSDGQNALEGGDLGWRKQAELPTLFASAVPALAVGEVSDVIRSGSGFHLVKLAEKRSEETHLVKQTKARHILINTNELVTDEVAQNRLNQLRERITNGEDFAELARAHSEDTGSAIDGGSLGWTSRV
ncbi:Chaperone SurA precursor [Methylophaga muralis]|uniref:Chaperone SurA n=1 Tax=Methylophaga muralis TaxID=291169 RepID=A0A1E3GUG4_9GAMM|nr:Chaperone SurA precursor [Methylophaga muralis]